MGAWAKSSQVLLTDRHLCLVMELTAGSALTAAALLAWRRSRYFAATTRGTLHPRTRSSLQAEA